MVTGGHTSGSNVVTVITTFTVVAGILTIARLYTRKVIVRNAGIDDYLNALGLILSVALTATMCEQVVYGMGRHESTLTPNDQLMSLRWFWASVWIYYLALWAVKLSILFQYLRLLPEDRPRYRQAAYAFIGIVTAWTFWAFFSAVFACYPIHAFWDMNVKGTCLNRLAVWFANAAVNIITDIGTAVLPIPALMTLRLPSRQKWILMGIFSLGGLVCIISILRLQSLYVISKSTDISWDNPMAATWSSLEVNVGIICSCIPTLKGLVSRIFPNLSFGTTYFRTVDTNEPLAGDAPHNEKGAPRVLTSQLGYHTAAEPDNNNSTANSPATETQEVHELSARSSRYLGPFSQIPFPQRSVSPQREKPDVVIGSDRFEMLGSLPPPSPSSDVKRNSWNLRAQEESARAKVRNFVQARRALSKKEEGEALRDEVSSPPMTAETRAGRGDSESISSFGSPRKEHVILERSM